MFFVEDSKISIKRFLQGNLVMGDFNIMEEANGVGKGITKTFDNVPVNDGTLEIHLYWAGKGTTAIPIRGVYGPLISAITVTPSKLPFILTCLSLCFCISMSASFSFSVY